MRVVAALMIALLGASSAAFAQIRSGVLDEYTVASWTDRDNLPSARIWAIDQDTDGYLWLGTDAGTFRFDGVRFAPLDTLMKPPSPPERPFAILASRSGGLWLGYGGGNIGRFKDGQLRVYSEQGIGPTVFAFLEAHDGTTWAGTSSGLFRLRGDDRWERIGDGLPDGPILTIFEDRARQLWAATRTTVLRRARGEERFRQVGLADSSGFLNARFSEDADGNVWMTDRHQGFRSITIASRPAANVDGSGNYVMHDRRGNFWVATGGYGLWRVRASAEPRDMAIERVTARDGLLSDTVRAMHEDREGNIWVGTYSGLQRFSPRRVKALTTLGIARALSVTPDGSIWVAAATALVRIDSDGTTREFGEAHGLPGPTVLSLHVDRSGVLWAGTDRGVARLVDGRFVRLPAPNGVELARPMTITSSPTAVWIRDIDRGLFKWENGALTASPLTGSTTTHADGQGRVWLGSSRGQITVLLPNDERRTHTLPIGNISSIYENRATGLVWIGGSSGLTWVVNDQFLSVTRENGFPGNVFSMVMDDTGTLWVALSAGIVRLEQSEFEKAAATPGYQLRYTLFDTSDGSAGVPTSAGGPNAVRSADGRLWFSTGNGLTIIDPQHLGAPRPAPAARIESGARNTQRFDLTPNLELPARTSHLQFEYTSLTLTDAARVRFRYRLDGFDDNWIDAGASRQATYTNLPPGDYRFRVMASNNDGRWNDAGAAMWGFTILPTFYQTRTFYAACVIALALLVWGAWQYRVTQVRRQFAMVLAERIRMSRTIHDTLLQGMVGIALQFNDLSKTIDATPGARDQLARIRRQVEEYIREARSSIWDLRSPRLEEKSLADALRDAGQRVAAGTTVLFELTVTGTPRECSPRTAEQLLLIGQEAVSNAVRHAQATHVRMELAYEDERVRLRISDDGRGFDIDVARHADGHYGLTSMRERAEEVRGLFNVVSHPGAGTQIEAVVPTS